MRNIEETKRSGLLQW